MQQRLVDGCRDPFARKVHTCNVCNNAPRADFVLQFAIALATKLVMVSHVS